MKKFIIITCILLVAAAGIIYYYHNKDEEQKITIVTTKPQFGNISKSVTATGSVEPEDTVTVGAQVSGVVTKVLVDYNSIVKKGQLLAQVDPSILQAQTAEAKANLVNANSTLAFQKNNYERQNQLYQLGGISKADYQTALNTYESAKANVDNAIAALQLNTKNLSYTNIYSPIDGTVLDRNISAGQTIASSFNAPVLFTLAKDLTKMDVEAAVDEADIGGVVAGQQATFTVDAFPDYTFKGTVNEIRLHPSVSANVVTYTTLIDVDNPEMKLKPGMTASINIYTQSDSNAMLIPSKAISFKPDSASLKGYIIVRLEKKNTGTVKNNPATNESRTTKKSFVWVKTGDTLTEKRIIVGLNDDTHVEVLKGLSPDDEVITGTATGEIPAATTDDAQRSPFMPQMQQKKPAAGAAKN